MIGVARAHLMTAFYVAVVSDGLGTLAVLAVIGPFVGSTFSFSWSVETCRVAD